MAVEPTELNSAGSRTAYVPSVLPAFDQDGDLDYSSPDYENLRNAASGERTRELERRTGQIIPWLFHRNGKRIKDFRGAWEAACKLAGVGRYGHDFRRTAVRNLERAGVSRSAAMKMTGHLTESVYRRYAITDAAMLREAGKKAAAFNASQRESVERKVVALATK